MSRGDWEFNEACRLICAQVRGRDVKVEVTWPELCFALWLSEMMWRFVMTHRALVSTSRRHLMSQVIGLVFGDADYVSQNADEIVRMGFLCGVLKNARVETTAGNIVVASIRTRIATYEFGEA